MMLGETNDENNILYSQRNAAADAHGLRRQNLVVEFSLPVNDINGNDFRVNDLTVPPANP
jgi:hypothetical protein